MIVLADSARDRLQAIMGERGEGRAYRIYLDGFG